MEYRANEAMRLIGALNVRELGGYVNRDGVRIRERKVLRGGDLSRMTKEDMQQLSAYGIHTCIDLRRDREKEVAHPFGAGGLWSYYAIPIKGKLDLSDPKELLYRLYQDILDEHKEELCKELRIIAAAEDGVVFHCTAGKDRTGVTAMLILALCDVCEEQIIADYAASAENNRELIKRQKAQLEADGVKGVPEEIFGSEPETMRKTLAYLKQQYGDVKNYMKAIGITDGEMEAIRKKLLG